MSKQYVTNIENNIKYSFKNKGLLKEALTHSSYSYEKELNYNYERFEFLGDAVVELVITEYLINNYKDYDEGLLSVIRANTVKENTLYEAAKKINLGDNIYCGKSEISNSNIIKKAIVADVVEAVIAAVYLDAGYVKAKELTLWLLEDHLINTIKNKSFVDSKTLLQQASLKDFAILPEYTLVSSSGPDHDKTFVVEVKVADKYTERATGKSRKKAEQAAAELVLRKYNG